ncbi:MAG: YdcF family protein [Alphaproteobacteria bacterium]
MTRGRRTVLAGALGALALAGVWLGGLVWFATSIPEAVEDVATRSDAIVVLTGGSVRLKTGLDLLHRNAADALFVSGVHAGVVLGDLSRTLHKDHAAQELAGRITLGHDADNTVGNATETAAWMKTRGYLSLRLVTSAYHMRRSLLEFHRVMPEVTIIPHPVFPQAVKQEEWWLWPGTASLIATEYTKYLFAYLRHRFADFISWSNDHDRHALDTLQYPVYCLDARGLVDSAAHFPGSPPSDDLGTGILGVGVAEAGPLDSLAAL